MYDICVELTKGLNLKHDDSWRSFAQSFETNCRDLFRLASQGVKGVTDASPEDHKDANARLVAGECLRPAPFTHWTVNWM